MHNRDSFISPRRKTNQRLTHPLANEIVAETLRTSSGLCSRRDSSSSSMVARAYSKATKFKLFSKQRAQSRIPLSTIARERIFDNRRRTYVSKVNFVDLIFVIFPYLNRHNGHIQLTLQNFDNARTMLGNSKTLCCSE